MVISTFSRGSLCHFESGHVRLFPGTGFYPTSLYVTFKFLALHAGRLGLPLRQNLRPCGPKLRHMGGSVLVHESLAEVNDRSGHIGNEFPTGTVTILASPRGVAPNPKLCSCSLSMDTDPIPFSDGF